MFKAVIVRAATCALCLFPFVVQAQISVTNTDVLSLLGKTQTFRDDTTGSVAVNVGTAGANRTWDFRALVIDGDNFTSQYVLPQNTPYAAQFPQANFVLQTTFTDSVPSTGYIYFNVTASSWRQLGIVGEFQDSSFVLAIEDEIAPLPLQFNTSWTVTSSDTISIPPAMIINKNTSVRKVDAWGTVRLPFGDVSCLRIRSDDSDISLTYFNGTLFFSDTSSSISYDWVAKEHGALVNITSTD